MSGTGRGRRVWWRWLGVGTGCVIALSGCDSQGITPGPLSTSLGSAFANLYVLQQSEQGNPVPSINSLNARAACQKGQQGDRQAGAGNDWVCGVTFLVAGPATPIVATYTVSVQTNGCYAAEGDGPTSVNGSPNLTDSRGGQRVNPLRLIQSCLDVG